LVAHLEHGAAYLGIPVLEGKIEMSGTGAGQIGKLALDPYQREVAVQQGAHLTIQA
jgi:hypothetical protein